MSMSPDWLPHIKSPWRGFFQALKHGAAVRCKLVVHVTHVLIHSVGQCLLRHLADLLILGVAVGILVSELVAVALGVALTSCELVAQGLLAVRVAHWGGGVIAAGVLTCAEILHRGGK